MTIKRQKHSTHARKAKPEFKFEIVEGEEMSPEAVDEIARILAGWLIRDLEQRVKDALAGNKSANETGAQEKAASELGPIGREDS